jgi:tRNA isopentenyl-2-thiomethyl-A-37 hydroxylase MiaE
LRTEATPSTQPLPDRDLPLPEEIIESKPTAPPPTPPPTQIPDSGPLLERLRLLNEFLDLSPKELENIRQTVVAIERMDEAERARLRKNLKRIQVDLESSGDKMSSIAAKLDDKQQPTFKRFWLSLRQSERTRFETELAKLNEKEKTEMIQERLAIFIEREQRLLKNLHSKVQAAPQ